MKMDNLLYKEIEKLSESIFLTIPPECLEGVKKNTENLYNRSKLIHHFNVPATSEEISS